MTPISVITKDSKEPEIRSGQVLSPNLGKKFLFSELFWI